MRWNRFHKPLTLAMVAIVVAAGGCAAGGSKPLPEFETVHIQSFPRPPNGLHSWVIFRTDASVDNIEGAEYGVAAGLGALVAAACTATFPPAAAQCLGAGAYTAGGTAAMGSVDSTHPLEEVDPQKRPWAEKVLRDVEDSREFFREIRDGVRTAMPADRQIEAEQAETLITVGPKNIYLRQEVSGLSLQMTAKMTTESNRHWRTPTTIKRTYKHTTAEQPLGDLLRDGGAGFDDGFTECVTQIIEMMARDLSATIGAPPRDTEAGEP